MDSLGHFAFKAGMKEVPEFAVLVTSYGEFFGCQEVYGSEKQCWKCIHKCPFSDFAETYPECGRFKPPFLVYVVVPECGQAH